MTRHSKQGFPLLWGAVLVVACVPAAHAQSPELIVRQVLLSNPFTAPYNLLTGYRDGKVVIAGTVGTKQIHDIAIRLAIATGYPIRDDLVIDTAAAHRVAAAQAQAGAAAGIARRPVMAPALGMAPGSLPYAGSLPYISPPPLFGRIDDPFFGFEPPLLSYPPWWGAVVARARAQATPIAPGNPAQAGPNAGGAVASETEALPSDPITLPLGPRPQDGTIEMTIDPRGVAVLRGKVPTLADRIAIGQKIAQTPGVSEVLNLLEVTTKAGAETTPPPPEPAAHPPGAAGPAVQTDADDAKPAIVVDGGALTDRLIQAFARRPALAGLPIHVTVRDGAATLEGRVPTVYEAMLAFRVVEQTPGIHEVIDRLEFVVPDGERQNPLIQQGRPEDVEPYLTAQIRRHVGDLAHIDRVRLLGDSLEVWGSLDRAEDRPRLDAILRSIAVLRGFRLEPHIDME
jgi:hypothetical protein